MASKVASELPTVLVKCTSIQVNPLRGTTGGQGQRKDGRDINFTVIVTSYHADGWRSS